MTRWVAPDDEGEETICGESKARVLHTDDPKAWVSCSPCEQGRLDWLKLGGDDA